MWCSQYFRDTQALFLVAHRLDDRNILAYLPLKYLELDFVCMNLHGGSGAHDLVGDPGAQIMRGPSCIGWT